MFSEYSFVDRDSNLPGKSHYITSAYSVGPKIQGEGLQTKFQWEESKNLLSLSVYLSLLSDGRLFTSFSLAKTCAPCRVFQSVLLL